MKNRLLAFLLICAATVAQARTFEHPGILHSREDLSRIAISVEQPATQQAGAWEVFSSDPRSSYDYKIQGPFPIIGRSNDYAYTKEPCENDFNASYFNSLMWIATKDTRHAQKSMEIIRAYAKTLKKISQGDEPLCAGLQGFILVNAAEIMRYTYTSEEHKDGWSEKDTEATEAMFKNVFVPVFTEFYKKPAYTNGNWGLAILKCMIGVGIFLNDKELYEEACTRYLDPEKDNGSLPNYIAESGQLQESGRDQPHCMLGLGCMAELCEAAWHQGDDLYSALNNRLMKGYEYVSKYNLGYDVPFFTWTDKTGKYSNWESISESGRGKFRPVFEIAYGHYVGREHLEMPYTEQVLGKIRPEGKAWSSDHPGFGTLLFYRDASQSLSSPDGKYLLNLTDNGGKLEYSIDWNGRRIIKKSQLGIVQGIEYLDGIKLGAAIPVTEIDTTWKTVYGEREYIRDHYRELSVPLLFNDGKKTDISLKIRAYNEGIAFRYCFTDGRYIKITDELTQYTLPEGTRAYFTARAQTPYVKLPLKDWPGDGESDRPLLLELPDGGYTCLAEAQVVNYVRTKFRLAEKANTIETAMYGPVEDIAPYDTPWRVIMCANKAGELIENNFIFYNLNDECAIKDPSWIKPGKAMREVTLSTDGALSLVDFAVKRNLQYILFDAGWYGPEASKSSDATTVTLDPARNPKIDDLDLQKVIKYAKSKGIGVFLYVNQRALQQQLDEILPLYESWGVSGIKFGFVQVGSQMWTNWLHEAVRKCAAHHLMVDIHDEYRPTGYSRTYPNLLTQEGVRGNEEFPDAYNNTIIPFTRFVAGPADYTICYYRQDFGRFTQSADDYGVPRSKTIKTTPAHQLALSVVYYSPLQLIYWYDKPSDSHDEPELKFFDDVYTVWDDTKVIEGEPGKYITVARRHGDEWFIGSITNEGRETSISLDFLPEGKYIAEIYTDGDSSIQTRTKVKVSKSKVNKNKSLFFTLRNSGGVAIHIIPENK